MNTYTVTIKDGSINHIMSAKGDGMTEAEAIRYVVSKQPWRVREAVEAGELEIVVTGDINNSD